MANSLNENSFTLRCSLLGHSQDVRAVTTSNSDIITVSRDQTARLWTPNPDNDKLYIQKIVYTGHQSFVSSVCIIEEEETFPDGAVATGSKDGNILVHSKFSSDPLHKLIGHTDSVSCLTCMNGYLISGSWDHTVRIWKEWKCVNILKGHKGPIWDVAVFDVDAELQIVSASADHTLKLWKNNSPVVTYSGHSDCVRGVSILNKDSFISCSNDASLKLWNISGDCLNTFYGHTNFVYCISISPDGQSFVSGSEDRSIRVWDTQGNNTQTLFLPAQSVWCVAVLPNSDIVAGTSDGQCRVFTRSKEREAAPDDLKVYEESLSGFKVAVEDIGGIKKSQIPDKTVLHSPGKRDGQTIMVKEGEKVLCYNWSQAKMEWEAVGEVVGGSGSGSGKALYEGREYDFVFDVDLDEGGILKLPYNQGDDPWVVAQAFIHKHELPQNHLDTVANFITTNAGTSSIGPGTSSGYYDPFTGGNRYVPGESGGGLNSTPTVNVSFTEGNGFASSSSVSSEYFPQRQSLPFESANRDGILAKLKESNKLVADPLSEAQMESMVNSVMSNSPELAVLEPLQLALQWHPKNVWPVLDVVRLALRHESVHKNWFTTNRRGATLVELLVQLLSPNSSPANTQLLALRCLSNMARHLPGREILIACNLTVITAALSLSPYPNKNMEIAAATLLVNYSYIFYTSKSTEDQCQILGGAATIALSASDSEALFRSLVAIGTLLSLGGELIPLAKNLDLKPVVENLFSANYPKKVQDCARDVAKML